MAESFHTCWCGERASGLFWVYRRDGSRTLHPLCASCGFNPRGGITHQLVKSFTTTIGPQQPKPELPRSEDFYIKRYESEPTRKWQPNFATGDFNPNPEWLR